MTDVAGPFAFPRDMNISNSTINFVEGDQTNIINNPAHPQTVDRLCNASAPSAYHDSPYSPAPCFPGTREGILSLIFHWIDNPNETLCWLSGPMGTGKSAIARTISQHCANLGRLGATFFCSRRYTDRSDGRKIISTIAYQLTISLPSLKPSILTIVEDDPLIFERAISIQFQKLIVDPITRNGNILQRIVVIIDALDECDDKPANEIARVLSNAAKNHDLPLQFLITSRPTSCIELPFMRNHSVITFFSLRNFEIHDDIQLYLTSRFQEIYQDHSPAMLEVAKPWPSLGQMDQLMKMSRDLFIYASSITRFVDDRSHSPDDRLKKILAAEQSSLSAFAELDQLYKQVLSECTDTHSLRLILGTIMGLQKPLPLSVIWTLVRSKISIGHLRTILHLLRSVLVVPEDEREPVTTFHQSFRDFLTDKARSGECCVDPETFSVGLADTCLDLLDNPESLELPNDIDHKLKGIALDYAWKHYLVLLRQEKVGDGCVLEFVQIAACNAAFLVWGTLVVNMVDNLEENIANAIVRRVVFLLISPIIMSFIFITLIIIVHPSRLGVTTVIMAAASMMLSLKEKVSFLDPVICRNISSSAMSAVTSADPFNSATHSISDVGTEMMCVVLAKGLSGSIIRALTFGMVLDLVIQAIIWVYAAMVNWRGSPRLTRTTMWVTAVAVGRGMGAAILASSGIVYTFLSLASITLVFNYCYHEATRNQGPLGFWRAFRPHESHLYLIQYLCRWTKARYHYALKRRKIPFSVTAPLHYASLIVEFYIITWKPTHMHMSARTPGEEWFCDWCGYT